MHQDARVFPRPKIAAIKCIFPSQGRRGNLVGPWPGWWCATTLRTGRHRWAARHGSLSVLPSSFLACLSVPLLLRGSFRRPEFSDPRRHEASTGNFSLGRCPELPEDTSGRWRVDSQSTTNRDAGAWARLGGRRRPGVRDLDSNFNHYIMQILDAKWDRDDEKSHRDVGHRPRHNRFRR
jgi:hypothetical protein